MLKVVQEEAEANAHAPAAVGGSLLDQIVREGARTMLAAALEAEVAAYVDARSGERDADGHRLVVRNGHHEPRQVSTAAGAVAVRAPRVNDKRIDEASGERQRFRLGDPAGLVVQVAAGGRGAAAAVSARPVQLGLRSGVGAVPRLRRRPVGQDDHPRLTEQWQDEASAFSKRSLAEVDYVYLWVDGIHLKVRLEQDKVCLLVMIGVRADGRKELIALADGRRESTESWADLLRNCKRRGMRAPVLAVRDGALGFWAAVRDVFAETREQRCWFHAAGNILDCLPKSAQPGARAALAEIYNAEDREHAITAAKTFVADYGVKWPKAAEKITKNLDVLLEFYNYPAEHWIHLRTTNPIESTFATVRLRQRVTKGPGSRAAGVAMAFKLIESAQTRWRAVNAPHLVALVRAGATFTNGKLVERSDEPGGDQLGNH